jgi:hypothetical protein
MSLWLDTGIVSSTLFEIWIGDVSSSWYGDDVGAWLEKYTQGHTKI